MDTLNCKNCGSTKFRKENKMYICQHCGSTQVSTSPVLSTKRKKLILTVVVALLIGMVALYSLLYKVDKNVKALKKETQTFNIQISDTSTQTPFNALNEKMKALIGKEQGSFPIEEVLKHYNKLAQEKAFFISLNKDGKYAYGYTGGKGSIQEASKEAFRICEGERQLRHLKEVCIPYIVNMHLSKMLTE